MSPIPITKEDRVRNALRVIREEMPPQNRLQDEFDTLTEIVLRLTCVSPTIEERVSRLESKLEKYISGVWR